MKNNMIRNGIKTSGFRIWQFNSPWGIALAYLVLLMLAEACTTLFIPRIGMILHGCIFVGLILQASLSDQRQDQSFLLALCLAPLIRLMSLSMPLPEFPFIYWYMVVGAPLFIAAYLVTRMANLTGKMVGLNLRAIFWQILVGCSGIGLGYLEYLILMPDPLVPEFRLDLIWIPASILLIFTGFLEELIFRGILQYISFRALGRMGIFYVAVIFAVLHLGYHSVLDVLFVLVVSLFFSYVVHCTGSLLGVTLSHGITNIFLFLVFPFIVGSPSLLPSPQEPVSALPQPATILPGEKPQFAPQIVETAAISINPTTTQILSPIDPSLKTNPSIATMTFTEMAQIPPSPTPVPDYVIDNPDTGFVRMGGNWWLADQGFGGDFIWSFTASRNPDTIVEWRPAFESCGIYDLQVFIPLKYSTSRSAKYLIVHSYGKNSITIDQKASQGGWVSLGVYQFYPPRDTAILRLDNATGEMQRAGLMITFDAARWVYVAQCNMEGNRIP